MKSWVNWAGYKMVWNNGKNIRLHRLIMSEYIGRELRSDEIVHHINGNRQDNRIENLVITTRKEHIPKYHMEQIRNRVLTKRIRKKKIKLCSVDYCNKKNHAKGFCRRHQRSFDRWGNPITVDVREVINKYK